MSESPELVQKLAARLKKIQNISKSTNKIAQTKMKIRYDTKAKAQNFADGDLVLRRVERYQMGVSRKHAPSWDGPHCVVYAAFNAPNSFCISMMILKGPMKKCTCKGSKGTLSEL